MVLLDELNIVLRYDYLPLDEVLAMLDGKPRDDARRSSPAATRRRS